MNGRRNIFTQSYPLSPASTVTVMAGESQLTPVNRFCYLGSYLSNTISVDIDNNSHLAKAGDAFDKLKCRLWGKHSVALLTKIAVYQAVVLSTLLYRCESWVLYRRSVHRLDEFHMRCLHKIAGIKRQDREPTTQKYHASVASVAIKRSYWQHNFAGLDMLSAWRTTGYTNRSSLDNFCHANAHSVVLLGVTRIQLRPT